MIQFDLPKEKSSIIKVIGIGGGGSNAVNYMYSLGIEGVNFIICNTDAQSIAHSKVPNKIQLGPHLTQGLGAGANPEIGRQATEESLEEIRRILEVNTKMAFITAGMGGGTGTGGAPIISKICKDLGILTVGIVTTPFTYEGKKRMLQAEDGIRNLKNYVDTLLIISNDKLRHQFGNLKMKEAFGRADNVLATAAKCITDVINTTGQINVDFADVCTVMRNGGVAILGSATASGMNRAQQAIEEALNSPLLNDTDVRGAKWILININSAEGEHEYTMDEVEVIQQYLLSRTGADTDLILGMGYDHQLGDRIGITLIATGFEQKNPFNKEAAVSKVANPEGKIMMTLEMSKVTAEEVIPAGNDHAKVLVELSEDKLEEVPERSMAPRLLQTEDASAGNGPIFFDLDISSGKPVDKKVEKNEENGKIEWVLSLPSVSGNFSSEPSGPSGNKNTDQSNTSSSAASGGYLAKPANIYAETETKKSAPAHEPLKGVVGEGTAKNPKDEEPSPEDMQLIIKDAPTAVDEPRAHQTLTSVTASDSVEEPAPQDETEELKRRAAERMQKLRNLSFNVNAADPNNEFETVPAYIRRNLDLYNTYSSVENFYSNYEVRKDDDQTARISTLNSFLDGKKPD